MPKRQPSRFWRSNSRHFVETVDWQGVLYDPVVNRIPWWAVTSAGAAPVLLAGGLAFAQVLQPAGYDPIKDTISALAADGAADRWVMTTALAGLGLCHVVTASGLRPARLSGRIVLAGGGLATLMVAAFPQPVSGNSVAHTVAASIAFTGLAVWPLFAARPRALAPLLTRTKSVLASLAMLGLVIWFALEVDGGQRGLAERAAAGAQALWPLAVVVTARRAGQHGQHKQLRSREIDLPER